MRPRLASAACIAGTFVLGVLASAQANPAPTAPDVIVSVRKAKVGADLVSVSARAANFPPALLERALISLCERLQVPARGIEVHRETFRPRDPSATIVKGSCAVDGLIDAQTGALAIEPIAQAFAGLPAPHTVRRMLVSFDGVGIGPKTMASHSTGKNSDLAFVGRPVGKSVEYDVALQSQDPTRLVVSRAATDAAPRPKPANRGVDGFTIALIAAAVVAAGALVYCLILLVGRRPMSKS